MCIRLCLLQDNLTYVQDADHAARRARPSSRGELLIHVPSGQNTTAQNKRDQMLEDPRRSRPLPLSHRHCHFSPHKHGITNWCHNNHTGLWPQAGGVEAIWLFSTDRGAIFPLWRLLPCVCRELHVFPGRGASAQQKCRRFQDCPATVSYPDRPVQSATVNKSYDMIVWVSSFFPLANRLQGDERARPKKTPSSVETCDHTHKNVPFARLKAHCLFITYLSQSSDPSRSRVFCDTLIDSPRPFSSPLTPLLSSHLPPTSSSPSPPAVAQAPTSTRRGN